MSLRALSMALEGAVSHEMLSRYEKGEAEPRPAIYEKLCALLEISDSGTYMPLLAVPEVKFRRSRWNIPQKEIEAVKVQALEYCNAYLELEKNLGDTIEWQSPFSSAEQSRLLRCMEKEADKTASMEDAADRLRQRWGLGTGPLPSVSALLEHKGILICELPFCNNRLDAFSFVHDGKPIICVADWLNGNPARKRMTLVHELAHILFPGIDADLPSDKEYSIMRFAGAFLMPRGAMVAALGNAPLVELPLYKLLTLKHYYGISIVGLMARAMQLRIIDWEQYCHYNARFFKQFHSLPPEEQLLDCEPGMPFAVPDASVRFYSLVCRALSTGVICSFDLSQFAVNKEVADIVGDVLA